MILYISPAEKNGGILQFSITILKETLKFEEAELFLPDSKENRNIVFNLEKITLYRKVKTLNIFSKEIQNLISMIEEKKPEKIIFLEDSILMQELNFILKRKGYRTGIIVHDVNQHPYHKLSPRKLLVEFFRKILLLRTVNKKNTIILLSKNSKEIFDKQYKKTKTIVMKLGAHVPPSFEIKPKEIKENLKEFLLFFGRIDKYKGIEDLCKAYIDLPKKLKEQKQLIIAGNGVLSKNEIKLISQEENIILINRFIEDGEMKWLYKNSKAIVLPYKEASQSGVLPIAYYFYKPVIISNQKGLVENVMAGETGYIYKNLEELKKYLELITYENFSKNIKNYYKKEMNWQINIKKMLEEI